MIEILETTTYENYNNSRHNYIVFKSPYGLLEVYKYTVFHEFPGYRYLLYELVPFPGL